MSPARPVSDSVETDEHATRPATSAAGADVRTRLLAAAGPVFACQGFERATVREICGLAHVNVASVAYYFGDKMGLYREVIKHVRDSRERRFPAPDNREDDPRVALYRLVHTMLLRMLAGDESGWESQLLLREMDQPTAVFSELVNEFFRPLFNRLSAVIESLMGHPAEPHLIEQLTFSVVGQCLYYRVGGGVVQILIPEERQRQHYNIDCLSMHITSVTLAATDGGFVIEHRKRLERQLGQDEIMTPGQAGIAETKSETRTVPGNTRNV